LTIIIAMLLTLALIVAMVPRIYWTIIWKEELCLEQETLRKLQAEPVWVLRHLRFSFAILVLVRIPAVFSGLEVPEPLVVAAAAYAASSLLFVILEGLLAQRVDCILARTQESVRVQD
jgi:hypothetical protein